jgi:serine/threonine protein kinase/HEAT repeat protein
METKQGGVGLVVGQLALGTIRVAAGEAVAGGAEAAAGFLTRHLTDHSRGLLRALKKANDNAWRALEIALAGDSFLDRCKATLAGGDYRGFRDQVRAFLGGLPDGWAGPDGGAVVREQALRELRAARKAGATQGGALDPQELATRAGDFARFGDPSALLEAERRAVATLAEELTGQGYPALAKILVPSQGPPLLAVAVRYFFRREVESDSELFQGLAWARLEGLAETQEQGFTGLAEALARHGDQLERALGEVREVVVQTRDEVLDVKQEVQRHGQQLQELAQAVLGALRQRQLDRREVRAGDSLSLANDAERQFVRKLVSRFRALPEGQRRQMPAMLNALGKLEVMAGDFEGALRDFQEAAGLVGDSRARAELHYNAYRAALERRDWAGALRELTSAVKVDARRFASFPMGKYHPQRIVGAGGFGVAFLCKHKFTEAPVLVKTLSTDGLDRAVEAVFAEAQALQQMDHPNIIRLHDCGFADPANKTRPYIMMEYFPGVSLEAYVEQSGPLPVPDALAVAARVAEALEAAHGKGILHRDIKPSNLLVRRETQPDGGASWGVKVIDFGLALRQDRTTGSSSSRHTLLGASIAGTHDYAAPEQMGKLPGTPVGPPADVYGFARTCCFALFGTPQPLPRHWASLPSALTRLLEDCLEEAPARRPQSLTALRKRLANVTASAVGTVGPEAIVPAEAVAVPTAVALPAVLPATRRRTREYDRDEYDERIADDYRPAPPRLFWIAGGIAVGLVLLISVLIVALTLRGSRAPESQQQVAQVPPTDISRSAPPRIQPADLPADVPPAVTLPRSTRRTTRTTTTPGVPKAVTPSPEVSAPRPAVPTADDAAAQAMTDLTNDSPARKRSALVRLARLRGVVEREDVGPAAAKLLKDPDNGVREAAARAVGAWGGADNVAALVKLLKDPDKRVRHAAVAALGHLKTEKAAEPLLKHLDVDFDQALEALKELGPLAEPAALARLKDKNADRKDRLNACKVLIFVFTVKSGPDLKDLSMDRKDNELAQIARTALGHDRAVVAALAHFTSDDPRRELRGGARQSLANLAPNGRRPQVVEVLLNKLQQSGHFPDQQLGPALAQWANADAVASLIQVLRSNPGDPFQHHTVPALSALGRLKDPRAVDDIVPLLANHFVHEHAEKALINMGDVAEWPLLKHLDDPKAEIRAKVCDVLRSIGTEDSVPALQAAALDSNHEVAAKANEALAAISRRGS